MSKVKEHLALRRRITAKPNYYVIITADMSKFTVQVNFINWLQQPKWIKNLCATTPPQHINNKILYNLVLKTSQFRVFLIFVFTQRQFDPRSWSKPQNSLDVFNVRLRCDLVVYPFYSILPRAQREISSTSSAPAPFITIATTQIELITVNYNP